MTSADAARTLRVEGELPDLAGAKVVTIDTPASIAVGDVPWGLTADVVVTTERYDAWRDVAGDPPLIVQVRDLHRQPWARSVLDHLVDHVGAHRVVVVEWGWPGTWPGRAGRPLPRICTHGWSRPGAVAVTDKLREAGWDR